MERLPTTPESAILLEVEEGSVLTTSDGTNPSTISHPILPTVIAPSTFSDPVSPSGDATPATRGDVITTTSGDPISGEKLQLPSVSPLTSDGGHKDSSETDTADEDGSSTNTTSWVDKPKIFRKRHRFLYLQDRIRKNGIPDASTSDKKMSSESVLPIKPKGRNKNSSETDTAYEGGSNTDTNFLGDKQKPLKKRHRFFNFQDRIRKNGVPVASTIDEKVSSGCYLPLKSELINTDSCETDTADEDDSSINTPSPISDDEQPRKRQRMSNSQYDPTSSDPDSSTHGVLVSSSVELQKTDKENAVSHYIDISDDSDSSSSISGNEQLSRDSEPSANDNLGTAKTDGSISSMSGQSDRPKSRDPVPSTSGQSVRPKSMDPVPSTSGQSVRPKNGDPAPSTSGQSVRSKSMDPVPSTSGQSVRSKSTDPVPSTSGQSVQPKSRDTVPSTSSQNISLMCDEDLDTDERPRVYSALTRLLGQCRQPQKGARVPISLYIPRDRGDSCEESPDEEIHSRVEKTERDLEADALRESVRKAVADSGTAIRVCERHKENAVWLKENSHEKVELCQENMVCMDLDSMMLINSHLRLFGIVIRRWDVVYKKLVERVKTAKDLRESLKKRLKAMAGERMNLDEANDIYDTIDNLNAILKYSDALLKCVMQRGDILNTIKNKLKRMTGK